MEYRHRWRSHCTAYWQMQPNLCCNCHLRSGNVYAVMISEMISNIFKEGMWFKALTPYLLIITDNVPWTSKQATAVLICTFVFWSNFWLMLWCVMMFWLFFHVFPMWQCIARSVSHLSWSWVQGSNFCWQHADIEWRHPSIGRPGDLNLPCGKNISHAVILARCLFRPPADKQSWYWSCH